MNPIKDRPTPETFAAKYMPCNARPGWTQKQWVVDAEFAENLERQKAALREALERLTSRRHYHVAGNENADVCRKCGHDFRNTLVHFLAGESPEADIEIARATLAATKPTK